MSAPVPAPEAAAEGMSLLQALVLGLVEGLTEYLPVSSTGHLLIAQRLIGVPDGAAANAYAVAIQAGAIVAVLGLYRVRVADMARGLVGRSATGLRQLMLLGAAFVPAAIAGLTLDDPIERVLFGPWPIVAAWAVGGALLLVFAGRIRGRTGLGLESLSPKGALIIGLCQCAALWPGTSRSLACIVGGLLAGLSLPAAVEFSFLLGVMTLGAATGYTALKDGKLMLDTYGWAPIAVGFAAAWLSAVASVRWMVGWLNTRGLGVFGWWRLIAAALVTALLLTGRI